MQCIKNIVHYFFTYLDILVPFKYWAVWFGCVKLTVFSMIVGVLYLAHGLMDSRLRKLCNRLFKLYFPFCLALYLLITFSGVVVMYCGVFTYSCYCCSPHIPLCPVQAFELLVWYLRIVHSCDFYSAATFASEDTMPHRCGIFTVRPSSSEEAVSQADSESRRSLVWYSRVHIGAWGWNFLTKVWKEWSI